MKIQFAKHEFWLDPSGILFWPEKSLAVVSDLHLEKGSYFALRGFFLPPYDSQETLERLHKALTALSARQVMVLGDGFHDANGYGRLPRAERASFDLLKKYDPIWIFGNHDAGSVPEGFTSYNDLKLEGVTFRHEATEKGFFEISGHFHPKANIIHKGRTISRPCFIEDGRKMILPSFGAFTGGLPITHPSITAHIGEQARIYAVRNQD